MGLGENFISMSNSKLCRCNFFNAFSVQVLQLCHGNYSSPLKWFLTKFSNVYVLTWITVGLGLPRYLWTVPCKYKFTLKPMWLLSDTGFRQNKVNYSRWIINVLMRTYYLNCFIFTVRNCVMINYIEWVNYVVTDTTLI